MGRMEGSEGEDVGREEFRFEGRGGDPVDKLRGIAGWAIDMGARSSRRGKSGNPLSPSSVKHVTTRYTYRLRCWTRESTEQQKTMLRRV